MLALENPTVEIASIWDLTKNLSTISEDLSDALSALTSSVPNA